VGSEREVGVGQEEGVGEMAREGSGVDSSEDGGFWSGRERWSTDGVAFLENGFGRNSFPSEREL
jgi:hypothetical protein